MDKGIMFLGIGFELIMLVLGGTWIGEWIDKKMGWSSVATAVLVILMLVVWFVHLIVLLQRYDKDNVDPNNPPQP